MKDPGQSKFPVQLPEDEIWGISVRGAGRLHENAATKNSPRPVPDDQNASRVIGNVASSFKIVFISKGKGQFQSETTEIQSVSAGDAMLVFPSVWHRYSPDPSVCWVEKWVELEGPSVRRALGAGIFSDTSPIAKLRDPKAFEGLMDRVLKFDPAMGLIAHAEAGAIGMLILAQLQAQPSSIRPVSPAARMVAAAEKLLAAGIDRPPQMPELARELGVGYSRFRKEFRSRTGLSPRRYLQQMRLQRTRGLLGSTVDSLERIAERMGFSSAFHLSAAFKKEFGVPPMHWRKQLESGRCRSDLATRLGLLPKTTGESSTQLNLATQSKQKKQNKRLPIMNMPFRNGLVAIIVFSIALTAAADPSQQGQNSSPSTPPPTDSAGAGPTSSQVSTPSNTIEGVSQQKATTLEQFTVSDVPLEDQILPTVRPIDSVYGDYQSVLDIPRSVSSVNKAWMDDRGVKNAMDFGQFSPGVYSAAAYGIPGVPQIRGDLGTLYINGQDIPYSRNSTPMSFNGIEAMDIVKGAGTAVYGPQDAPGGYVNLVPKQPNFEGFHADISATLGYLASGRDFSNPEYTLDFGGPISPTFAYRVSYLGRYGDEYYINGHNESQDVYMAATWRPSSRFTLEGWAWGYVDRTNENTGANRVTQNFIWNGQYIAGPTVVATTGPLAYYGYDVYLPSDGAPSFTNYPSGADGAYQIVDPAKAHTVILPNYDALIGQEDVARAKFFQAQLKATLQLGANTSLVNVSYWALQHSDKWEPYGYDEWMPRHIQLKNRTELHTKLEFGKVENEIITGLDLRYDYVRSYTDYTIQPTDPYDLTQPLTGIPYPGYYIENDTFGSGDQIPGRPGFSAGDFNDSEEHDYAVFLQDTIKYGKHWSAILGLREDAISVWSANAPVQVVGETSAGGANPLPLLSYSGYYSLPTPIFEDRGALFQAHGATIDPAYFASLIYKLNDTQSFYVTCDSVDSAAGQANFSGVVAAAAAQVAEDLKVNAYLFEAGYKGSFIGNTLFADFALYNQVKTAFQINGAPYRVKTQGVEAEIVYQPTKRLSINANVTYQNATAYGGYFFQETGNYLDLYATTTPVDGTYGTGIGGDNYSAYEGYGYRPAAGKMIAPGVPQFLLNAYVDYGLTKTLSIGAGPSYVGHMFANDQDTLHIPGEYQVDGHVIYTPNKRWDVRVNITNILNHRLLDPIDVSFAGNEDIYVRPPIEASLTIRLHY